MDDRLGIGGNNPPEPTPFEAVQERVNDALGEARAWLDGAAVADKDQADGLALLLDTLRKAEKETKAARKTEIAPIDEAWAAVNDKYKTLSTALDRAIDTVKAAIAKWQREEQRKADEAARVAREAAEAAAREAAEARQKADLANLAEREAADAALAEAERLAKAAKDIEAAPVGAKAVTGGGRRTALIVTREPVGFTDRMAALKWAIAHRPDDLADALLDLVRKSKVGDVPGVVYEERTTVR